MCDFSRGTRERPGQRGEVIRCVGEGVSAGGRLHGMPGGIYGLRDSNMDIVRYLKYDVLNLDDCVRSREVGLQSKTELML